MAGLATIQPTHADSTKIPAGDDGKPARQVGNLRDGRAIWERTLYRSVIEKEFGPDGKPKWELHPTTAQPLYLRHVRRRKDRTQTFTLESDGHANLYVQEYNPPSPEEEREAEIRNAADTLQTQLARTMAERGITPDRLLDAVLGAQQQTETLPEKTFPHLYAPGRWELFNGSKMQGSRDDALEAEARLRTPPEETEL
jgi:hypothetical protein